MASVFGNPELETEVNIVAQQQEFTHLFGHPSSIIYDCYTTKEALTLKLNLILPHIREDQRNNLISTLWDQRENTGGKCLFMSPIFITLVFDHTVSTEHPVQLELKSKNFLVHPVFRVQKCVASKPGDSCANCCAIFVDETARVYSNWLRFRTDNRYEDGLVVAPLNGIYNCDSKGFVTLELFLRKAGITKSLDRGSTVIGLASAGVAVVTFIPALAVAPAVAVGAAVAGISCAVYSGFRGLYDLYDRKSHKQSINIKDRDARSSWLNVAAGAFSAGAAGATTLIATAAQNGNSVSNIARSTVHALNVGALSLNTTGCLDGIHTMIKKMYEGDHISLLEISQLSALLFLLTHSVKNYRTAESVLALSQTCDVEEFKKILTDSQKMAFNALVHETMAIQCLQKEIGQIVIRSLKNWIDPDPVLLELSDVEDHDEISSASNSTSAAEEAKDEFEQEKQDVKVAVAKSEYSHLLDSKLGSLISRLISKFKTRGEDELKLFLINTMQELSIKSFDIFIDFVESMIDKYGSLIEARSKDVLTFEHMAVLILKQLKIISADSNVRSLKEYLIGLTERERQRADIKIREYFEHLKEEHVSEAENMLAAQVDISDDAKLSIMIDEQVDNLVEKFKALGIVYTLDDLRETIKDVLQSLSLSASHVFFGITKKFIQKNGENIQQRLGRFIPIDVFMTDIYSMLRKFSVNRGQELEFYLLDYSEDIFDEIEKDIHEFYDNQLITGNSNQCQSCGGIFYN